jgi:hypothetical protein
MMRQFSVVVYREGQTAVSYPARGCDLLTGQQAIGLMRTMEQRGLESVAITEASGIKEQLTLTEMENVVL